MKFNVEVMNEWCYTSTPSANIYGLNRNNLNLFSFIDEIRHQTFCTRFILMLMSCKIFHFPTLSLTMTYFGCVVYFSFSLHFRRKKMTCLPSEQYAILMSSKSAERLDYVKGPYKGKGVP